MVFFKTVFAVSLAVLALAAPLPVQLPQIDDLSPADVDALLNSIVSDDVPPLPPANGLEGRQTAGPDVDDGFIVSSQRINDFFNGIVRVGNVVPAPFPENGLEGRQTADPPLPGVGDVVGSLPGGVGSLPVIGGGGLPDNA